MSAPDWPIRRPAGLGGITDSNLQSAATELYNSLHSDGCSDGFDQAVADFQDAWNASNAGTKLIVASGAPGADGLYGANTQSALQATLNASGHSPVPQAPTGCVAAAAGSANATEGGGAATDPTGGGGTASKGTWILWVVGAASVAALGTAIAVHEKKKQRAHA